MGYRPYNPHEPLLFGYDPVRDLPADHLARFVDSVVDETLEVPDLPRRAGQPGYNPRLVVKVLVYGYATGVRSSRQLEQNCQENLAYRYLVGDDVPSYRTLCSVRKEKKEWLESVWLGLFSVAKTKGMEQVGRIVVDASKLRANASRESVLEADEFAAMRAELERILNEAEEVDAKEAERGHSGKTRLGKEVAGEQMRDILRRVRAQLAREKRRKKEEEEKGVSGAVAVEAAQTREDGGATAAAVQGGAPTLAVGEQSSEAAGAETAQRAELVLEPEEVGLEANRRRGGAPGVEGGLSQRMYERVEETLAALKAAEEQRRKFMSTTDPDAEMMPEGAGRRMRECHSLEAAVDKGTGMLAAVSTTQEGCDNDRLEPIVALAKEELGVAITEVDSDAGFFKGMPIVRLEEQGIDTCVPDSSTAADLHRGRPVGANQAMNGGTVPLVYDEGGDCFRCERGMELGLAKTVVEDGQQIKLYVGTGDCSECPLKGKCFHNTKGKHRTVRVCEQGERIRGILERFNDPERQQRYRDRMPWIEGVWGFLKGTLGYDRWVLRGKDGVAAEGRLFKVGYQVRKVHRALASA